jgi:formylglycine-generating enzyme required for sulfatase activity
MKRLISIFATVLLASSLFTCATQDPLTNTSMPLRKMGLAGFSYKQGTIFDREKYDSVREISGTRGPSARGDVPKSFSLKDYAPLPGNQGDIGSCFAWASAYAARTIIESQYLNRTDKILTTKMAYSPMFLYHMVRQYTNYPADEDGASIFDTVQVMVGTGLPRRVTFDEALAANILQTEQQRPFSNPVVGFGILFTSIASPAYRIDRVKRSIMDGNPVIIGVFVPDSFKYAKDLWVPEDHERPDPEQGQGHALCVVGYDDDKYGGAFEIMNSWGEEWGNGGYIWISYDTFGKWVEQAWVISDDTSLYEEVIEFTGKVNVEVSGKSEAVQVKLLEDGIYRLPSTVKNGSQIRLSFGETNILQGDGIYTYAFYTNSENNNTVKISNNEWITPGNAVKNANFVILYSRSQLDIDSLLSNFAKQRGNVSYRLESIIGKDFILFDNSRYDYSTMQITADLLNKDSVAGMILSVNYDADEKPISDMVRIKGGSFMIGSPSSEEGRYDDEKQKRVTVKDYYIGYSEVAVGEFRDFVNATGYKTTAERSGRSIFFNGKDLKEMEGFTWQNPGFTQEDTHPVVHISLYDAIEYCNWRSKQEGFTSVYTISGNSITVNTSANGYRLPTEAEWEYACRAGTTTPYYTGRTISANQANFAAAAFYKSTPVRKYAPNQWGIYDMHGNVFEWCSDNIRDNLYGIRGGTWSLPPNMIRSAFRDIQPANVSTIYTGFRLARNGS